MKEADTSSYTQYNNDNPISAPELLVNKVIEKQLKQILKKDLNKRTIQYMVYKKYEATWEEGYQNKSPPFYYDFEGVLSYKDLPESSTSLKRLTV